MEAVSYLDSFGNLSTDCPHLISKTTLLKGYEAMVTTRLVDERMLTIQRQGLISFSLSSLGEEACAVASAAALELADWMYPQYREAGIMFWRGYTILEFIHHMFNTEKDLSMGRQMPNHFGSKNLNVVPVSSPIGTKIPHAAGCAYAMKLKKEKTVAIAYFGEGATSEGDFHAGLNFAAVRKAPTIFFCRNNGYAISTPAYRQFASDGVAPKGIGYGMHTLCVDGNDFFAVHEAVAKARQHCLDGLGPVLIEAMTFRMGAHSTSDDPSIYRVENEAKIWETKCPIMRLRHYLINQQWWSEGQEEALIFKITEEINQAISIAKLTPPPPLSSLIEHVYADVPTYLQEQYKEILNIYE